MIKYGPKFGSAVSFGAVKQVPAVTADEALVSARVYGGAICNIVALNGYYKNLRGSCSLYEI